MLGVLSYVQNFTAVISLNLFCTNTSFKSQTVLHIELSLLLITIIVQLFRIEE